MAGVLALAGLLAAAVAPAQAAEIRVIGANNHTVPVQLDTLLTNPDVRDRPYVVRAKDGTTTTRTVTGVSLKAVLEAAGAEIDQFGHAEIQASTSSLVFSREQALKDDAWGSVDGPPVFTVTPDGYVSLLRPSMGEGDANGQDELMVPGGMAIRLRTKIDPRVLITASTTSPDVGEKVTFSATVSGVGVGEAVAVTWLVSLKGGGDAKAYSGEEIAHVFRKKGTYAVMATMKVPGSEDDVYDNEVVTIKVGGPEEKKKPEKEEPETAAPGTGGTAAGTGSGAGTAGSGSGTGDGAGAAGATTPPAAAATPSEADKPKPKRDRKPKKAAPPEETKIPGEVTGELLVADTTPVATPARQSVAPPLPDEGAGGAFGLPPAAWTGIGVGVALAAGFALDRRRLGRLA